MSTHLRNGATPLHAESERRCNAGSDLPRVTSTGLASGGGDADMPEVQVTDLRTLAWQMQVDGAQDWRPLLFVAPQPSIDYVQRAQEQADDAGDAPPLTRNDVMGLLFPQADAGTPNAL